MYLQEILEVAIGLVFMWLVLSIAAMTIQEWIGNVLNMRAKDLEQNLQEMLNSDELTKQIYEHPLITSLYHPAKRARQKPRLPAYMPAGKFASALFDIVIKAGTDSSPIKNLTGDIGAQLAASLDDPSQLKLALDDWKTILETAKQIAASGAGQTAVDTLKVQIQAYGTKYPEVQPTLDQALPQAYAFYQDFLDEERTAAPAGTEVDFAMRQFRLGLKIVGGTNPKLKDTLTALLRNSQLTLQEGEQSVLKARLQFETWFNDAMERLSGSYKRKAQLISFVVGFFLALILNVDSINVATSLWREPTLRLAIIAQASAFSLPNQQPSASTTETGSTTSNPLKTIPDLQKQLQVLNFPFGWTANPVPYKTTVNCDLSSPSVYDSQGNPNRILGVHMGQVCVPIVNALPFNPDNLTGWLTKLLGLVITGAAAAQGAPFWFDILKKFVNVRGTGTNPSEKTAVG